MTNVKIPAMAKPANAAKNAMLVMVEVADPAPPFFLADLGSGASSLNRSAIAADALPVFLIVMIDIIPLFAALVKPNLAPLGGFPEI